MSLASELKELTLRSHEERLQIAAKVFADQMRQDAREYALLGIGCFQNSLSLTEWEKEVIQAAAKQLEQDGFWVVFMDNTFAMSWSHGK